VHISKKQLDDLKTYRLSEPEEISGHFVRWEKFPTSLLQIVFPVSFRVFELDDGSHSLCVPVSGILLFLAPSTIYLGEPVIALFVFIVCILFYVIGLCISLSRITK